MLDDRQIRALLQDAEEKVPRKVWSAVASRLDSPAVAPVWKWVGVSFALAAALAAGFLLTGTSDKTDGIIPSESIAQTSIAPEQEEIAPQKASTPQEASIAILRPCAEAQEEASTPAPLYAQNDAPAAQDVPAAQNAPAAQDAPASSDEVVEAPAEDHYESDYTASDPFAELEKEQRSARTERKPQINLGGSVGGNAANATGISKSSSGFSSAPASDVLTEVSNSNYSIPFTIGVGLRFHLASKLLLGTGIDYSLLTRTFDGTFTPAGSFDSVAGDVRGSLHYIGIPVRLYYNIVDLPALKFYAYGGGEAEWCISNRFDFRPSNGSDLIVKRSPVEKPQFSIGAGVGVQFRLTDKLGLYLDPGVNYYFYCSQPKSIRTERPLLFNLSAGLRFDL